MPLAGGTGLVIDRIKLGNGGYTPGVGSVALQSEQLSVLPVSTSVANQKIVIEVMLQGARTFSVREFGLFLADGTMVAVYSHPTVILAQKVAGAQVKLVLVIDIDAAAANAITFSVADFGEADFHQHANNTNNPHRITLAQIGALSAVQINAMINNITAANLGAMTRSQVIALIESRTNQNFYVDVYSNGQTRDVTTVKNWARVLLTNTDNNDIIVVKWRYLYSYRWGNGTASRARIRFSYFIHSGVDWINIGGT